MNILYLNFLPIISYIGGVQKITDTISKELLHRGHHIIYVHYKKTAIPEGYEFTCPQYYLNPNSNSFCDEWLKLMEEFHIDVVINQRCDEISNKLLSITPPSIKRITILHIQPFTGLDYVRKLAKVSQPTSLKEWILKIVGIIFPGVSRYYSTKKEILMLDQVIEKNDKICVFSNGYIERIKRFYPSADIRKFVVIPNPNTLEVGMKNNFKRQKQNVVLFVGRLYNNPKNVIDLLQIWNLFRLDNPGWECYIVGDGPEKERFESYCSTNHIEGVVFCGRQENVSEYYEKSKIFCLTSIHESWNLCLVEAMSKGSVPIAFGSYEAVSDIIDDKRNGYIVKPFQKKQMVEYLNRLSKNDELLTLMSEAAMEKSRVFNLQTIVDRWEQLISE